MTLIDLDAKDFPPENVIKFLNNNQPFVIRNFLTSAIVSQYLSRINSANLKKYMIGTIPAYALERKDLAKNEYLDVYDANNDLIKSDIIRVWKHHANNLTRWHFDGNGTDLLNISLQGKKRFYLAPPNTNAFMFPLTNIVINDFKEKYMVEIEPGDMLFIPAYWFHKVLTLKDNTININYTLFDKKNRKHASSRDIQLFGLHNIFNTNMDKEILDIYKNENKLTSLLRGFYEMSIYIVLFICIYLNIKKYNNNRIVNIFFVIGIMTGVYLYDDKQLSFNSCGISELYGVFLLFIFCMLIVYDKYKQYIL